MPRILTSQNRALFSSRHHQKSSRVGSEKVSGRWGPAALGMGRLWGLKSGRFVGLGGSLRAVPESNAIMPAYRGGSYSPLGLIRRGTKVPAMSFESHSPVRFFWAAIQFWVGRERAAFSLKNARRTAAAEEIARRKFRKCQFLATHDDRAAHNYCHQRVPVQRWEACAPERVAKKKRYCCHNKWKSRHGARRRRPPAPMDYISKRCSPTKHEQEQRAYDRAEHGDLGTPRMAQ